MERRPEVGMIIENNPKRPANSGSSIDPGPM
jgi:hypothetical protein